MRDNIVAGVLFILCGAALVLPWFTCSGSILGYSWILAVLHISFFLTFALSSGKGTGKRGGK